MCFGWWEDQVTTTTITVHKQKEGVGDKVLPKMYRFCLFDLFWKGVVENFVRNLFQTIKFKEHGELYNSHKRSINHNNQLKRLRSFEENCRKDIRKTKPHRSSKN